MICAPVPRGGFSHALLQDHGWIRLAMAYLPIGDLQLMIHRLLLGASWLDVTTLCIGLGSVQMHGREILIKHGLISRTQEC